VGAVLGARISVITASVEKRAAGGGEARRGGGCVCVCVFSVGGTWVPHSPRGGVSVGVYRCVPADQDQSNAKLTDADLPGSDLSGFDLSGAHMENALQTPTCITRACPQWSSGLLVGVKLAGAEG
jgi:uncharacterized protein YjbI with pentapeptide repeats